MKTLIKQVANCLGYEIKPLRRGKPSPVHLWEEDPVFNRIYAQILGHTLVSKQRCFMLYQLARMASVLPGDVAEIGVYRGGTAKLLSYTFGLTENRIHLFDTFSGMPETNPERDKHVAGAFSDTSLENVKAYLHDCAGAHFYQGVFPATAQPVAGLQFRFVHIDVDIHSSVLACCTFFYPRVVVGGILIFDDYGDISCPGAKDAVEEFFAGKPEKPVYLPTGQCVAVKLPV